MRTRWTTWPAAVAAALLVAGCGSDHGDSDAPSATLGTSGARVDIGQSINYGSVGTTADIDCADGKALNIAGSNNKLTVKGTCASVTITGADNRVTIDRVEKEIHVLGLNNTVNYRDGEPSVHDAGSNNTVTKG
ncbi:hypothetical protein C731_1041 [Mycolicibacterium hassiacum DSM 44199]|jgi:hypothetical protein|uniref:Uncharacterized protein n=1 Tax=Mycolicibacterium hassiacum (strain DSM 44199 / CIP 105218 / JCM 12690 / 3849) TaxID=1122247 RepID=K5BHH7_MYCHD|nr:DUF3060 domain-containing protein [Mycolicibacterium hassiacum]EKF24866.1 hypothetical protein C731_1041 [Mycolicibacterium hassiacum DSM 44199]MBX5486139.1 DUF3060 domain-containing protein [Mycolicibacterium hassiacum]MDA4088172.1 hypothetical protein [Mycolicibacterium hassiacum DSM 44199]PZN21904.1 MAG: DUF3060 domain-containing protein [Mycolicibacterium hassiacum]VCT88516.1 hypothetical protein MHAS_00200 [Mycolicibacterium hassiacum DSM 44199]